MPLRDVSLRAAKGGEKPYKVSDGGGLFVLVQPNGARYWRLAYRYHGRQKLLALGVYPEVTLAEARDRRDAARKLLAAGNDPSEARKEDRRRAKLSADNSFEALAREWHETRKAGWTERYAGHVLTRLEADLFPIIGKRPIAAMSAPELLAALKMVENRGALDIASRLLQTCGAVFRYAVVTGRMTYNPAPDLRGALKSPEKKRHHAALTHDELPEFLHRLSNYDGEAQTSRALRILSLTFVRTNELRAAKWTEFDLDAAEWRVPPQRMKMREEHIVPLSSQAVQTLQEQQGECGGHPFVFPSRKGGPSCMSENTMLYALYRMGYHSRATGHGFRTTASTILNEMGFHPDWIERQLAHGDRNKVRAAYNRAQYLTERRRMMQHWADYLDTLAAGGKLIRGAFARAAG
ncbi:MAG: integrase arm-type DNA-binding domain-containing protein [Caulobacteraceae bacterium]